MRDKGCKDEGVQAQQAGDLVALGCRSHIKGRRDGHFTCELCCVIIHSKFRTNLRWSRGLQSSEPCHVQWDRTLYVAGMQNSSPDDKIGFGIFDEDIAPHSLSCVQISSVSKGVEYAGCCVLLLLEEESMPAHHYRRIGVGWLPCRLFKCGWRDERVVIV